MLQISKLADYGTSVMTYMARHLAQIHNARDIALHTHISLPTVSKLLKLFAKNGLLESVRGSKGGYRLLRDPKQVTVSAIISAVDGQFGVTDCSHTQGLCNLESFCAVRSNWRLISDTIYQALETITLEDMAKPRLSKRFNIQVKYQPETATAKAS